MNATLLRPRAAVIFFNRAVTRSVSNGENQRDLTTYLWCTDPNPQDQQQRKMVKFWNKAEYFVKHE
jgi:hypothetical protein